MTPNQELYAKSLKIAVLLLGNTGINGTEELSRLQQKFQNYDSLTKFIANKILDAPNLIPQP